MPGVRCLAVILTTLVAPLAARGGDWPLWRYDAQRSAASPHELPPQLQLHWVRELPKLTPAWPDQAKMQFDAAHEPIAAGQRLFIGSSHDHSIAAYSTRTGEELWTFFADGPVRFAPLSFEDKLYFVSDDGYLYCLKAADGSLVWKFRGGPSDRKILGNERMISTWPARGAPVVADGKIYFAAGIWPFMGIFLHAVDARSGELLWTNDGDGSIYMKQPHNADSFAGVAPQGALVAIGEKLLVPGGRSVPACYDRATGKLLYYQLAENAKRGGGSTVAAVDNLICNGGAAFDLATEKHLGDVGEFVAFAGGRLFDANEGKLREIDLARSSVKQQPALDRKGKSVSVASWSAKEAGKASTPKATALIKAGSRLYVGSAGRLLAFSLPLDEKGEAKPVWEATIEGTPVSLIAADDRLYASTLEGRLYCFGVASAAPAQPHKHALPGQALVSSSAAKARAEEILKSSGVSAGYCLIIGAGDGSLAGELARQGNLRIVVVEPDAAKARACREKFRAAGLGGDRASVIVAEPSQISLPPYVASLAVAEALPAEAPQQEELLARIYAALRPFGGVACLPLGGKEASSLPESTLDLQNASWKPAGEMMLLTRVGPLPESADWSHEHADAANTRVSKDKRVKAPLGLLWFGGPTNEAILPRHGHGPQPQVVEGRLVIEGVNILRAMDIYTGRLLWEASLPGIGKLYDNTAHQPGANGSGTNYITTPEGIFVAYGKSCLKLDPATGQKTGEYRLPADAGAEPPTWGYINVFENYLVGGAEPQFDPGLAKSRGENDNFSSSQRLFVLDRTSGKVLWTVAAKSGFRHNAICIGGGRLYCIDRPSGPELSRLKRRGETAKHPPRLLVFDLASGRELWSSEQDVFGTWLSYSAERDVLVEAGRPASDTISDEPKGMRAYYADKGGVLWENKSFSGPAMLHHDTILMAGKACDLLTGAQRMRAHPLSGESVEWTWSRNYGCNTPMASEHLLTFRSGAAGYFDMCNDGGTGNFGGFRSSCSNNLIVAGGLLTAPDYTRTCVCSYQNQTSLALIHTPEVETWTFFGAQTPKERVRSLGLNFGAPGDRKDDAGTLWLEVPSVGGSSPTVDLKLTPDQPRWFRRHSSQVSGAGLTWVAASGAEGLSEIRVKLAEKDAQPRPYTVRLHFLEPDDVAAGERVFSVSVQGRPAFPALDVFKEAGGRNHGLVKEIKGVSVGEELVIGLSPAAGSTKPTLLSGIEIQAEGW
jgi:outer membrane protein assembly factor BamB